jgi:Brp/Blh family beta-carotene 15,15'-monooxygenase
MSKIELFFIGFFVLLLGILFTVGYIAIEWQVGFCALFICVLGIPHGAIDHIIFMQDGQTTPVRFYSFYFGLMAAYALVWMYFPITSMIAFLLLSAFHFGQSQFTHIKLNNKWLKSSLYLVWGISILSALVVYNHSQIEELASLNEDVLALMPAFHFTINVVILISTSLVTTAILVVLKLRNSIDAKTFGTQFLLFGVIHLSFLLLPLLVGFTLYFSIIHSMHVLLQEFSFLKRKTKLFGIKHFIKLLTPYTLVSIVGLAVLLTLSYLQFIPVSGTLLVFIVISILTLPHSIVMDNFYFKLTK